MPSERLRLAWRRRVPLRPERFLAALALGGLCFALGILAAGELLPWIRGPLLGAPFVALHALPSFWLAGWLLRSRIAGARGGAVLLVALQGTLLGSYVLAGLFLLTGGFYMLASGQWFGLVLVALDPLWAVPFALVGAVLFFPATYPLSLLAILLLRAAAGGTTDPPPRRRGAPLALPS